jgi:hypothetical protein
MEPENPKGNSDVPRSSVTTLLVGMSGEGTEFVDVPGAKIERRLEQVAKTILILAEIRMRRADFSEYERKLERKKETLAQIAEQKRKDEAMRLAAIKARKEAIRKEIADTASNFGGFYGKSSQ